MVQAMVVYALVGVTLATVACGLVAAAFAMRLPEQWKLEARNSRKRSSTGRRRSSKRKRQSETRRPLGPLERHMVRFGAKYSGSQKAALVVTLDRPVSMDRLQNAVDILQKRHPFARSHLTKDWSSVVDPGPERISRSALRVSEHGRVDDNTWQAVWREVMATPVKREVSPFTIDVVNGDEKADIVLACDHYGGDGCSLIEFMHELLQCMADAQEFQASHPPLELKPHTTDLILSNHMTTLADQVKSIASFTLKRLASFPAMTRAMMPKTNTSKHRPSVKNARSLTSQPNVIDAETMQALAKLGKTKLGATVNVLLTAATMKALSERLKEGTTVHCNAAMNLRGRLAGGKAVSTQDLGYYAGAPACVSARYGPKESPWEKVASLKKQYQGEFNEDNICGSELGNVFFMGTLPNEHLGFTATLSNWGRTPFPADGYGQDVGKVLFAKPLFNGNVFAFPYVAFLGSAGNLEISVVCSDRYFKQEDVDSLSKSIRNEVENMVAHAG